MRYILDTGEFVKLSETTGTVMNIGGIKIELSNTAERGTGIILAPRKKITIKGNVYAARSAESSGVAILATFESGGGSGGTGSDDEHFDDDDLNSVFDDDETPSGGTFTDEDIADIFGD